MGPKSKGFAYHCPSESLFVSSGFCFVFINLLRYRDKNYLLFPIIPAVHNPNSCLISYFKNINKTYTIKLSAGSPALMVENQFGEVYVKYRPK